MADVGAPIRRRDGAMTPAREFHVSRACRVRYGLDDTFFSTTGRVILANFHAARVLAQRISEARNAAQYPERAVRASELNALGLLEEILHYVIRLYQTQRNPQALTKALAYLERELGTEAVDALLETFVEMFPPKAVHRGDLTPQAYLQGETDGISNRAVALEELWLLWIANENPAASPLRELFDDAPLQALEAYQTLPRHLETFFAMQPPFGPENQSLFEMLLEPIKAAPGSLQAQLEYVRQRWGPILGTYLTRLLSSLDFLEEEYKALTMGPPGPGPAEVYEFEALEEEPERFSLDRDWMPKVVMIAKNVYVWLDQLSRFYGRPIRLLSEVPDEELDRLRRYGFTAIWLIGVWERSPASRRIKQMMGNPDAVASAYSIRRYAVAEELGGEAAFEDLKGRAWRRGIRMATDMVPNHMGIDSDWVIEHPDWFISLDYSPFPTYSYTGPDLCDDPRVGVYLEDHYYDHTDAAVTFQRRDHWTGDVRYIYHGNDGTQMPWNDTAQLNYLKSEVREAVIRTILAVARRSPIIRFDAAMTLTRRHYQRLWFPEPGTGGDIPSRADFAMTKEEFNRLMPEEFWREVVERVAAEAPDTLLLAEAFWMMEGYFVRSLGMHRVYNSAFMNMLRDEKNAEYRQVMKNTLEFDPQILRRYVNFMNNPDERTAVDQFGKGDKYFGVCTLLVTMPGLPMFGHGQIEGFTEKYGMEFRRAYLDELPDPDLVARHEREIFPLLHKRYLFADVDHFLLYDFVRPDGSVDENVFAYSNRVGEERAVILYHNRFADTRGWVHTSVAYAVKEGEGERQLVRRTLAEGLGLHTDPGWFVIFRDASSGLEYLRNCQDLAAQGLYAELNAYKTHVFLDFREVLDDAQGHYAQLCARLNGRGVPKVEEALRELTLRPVLGPYRALVSAPTFRWLIAQRSGTAEQVDAKILANTLAETQRKVTQFLGGAREVLSSELGEAALISHAALPDIAQRTTQRLAAVLGLPGLLDSILDQVRDMPEIEAVALQLRDLWSSAEWEVWCPLFGWLFVQPLDELVESEAAGLSRSLFDEWLLHRPLRETAAALGLDAEEQERVVATVRMLLTHQAWLSRPLLASTEGEPGAYQLLRWALGHSDVRRFLGVHRYGEVLWFHKESFEQWLWWLGLLALLTMEEEPTAALVAAKGAEVRAPLTALQWLRDLQKAEGLSGYQVGRLLEAARGLTPP